MADERYRALLERLERQEARLAAHERLLARYQPGVAPARRPRVRRGRRGPRAVAALLLALLLASIPLGLLGAGFTDLNPQSPHNGNINAIAAAASPRAATRRTTTSTAPPTWSPASRWP